MIPVLQMLRQEDVKFKTSLDYIARLKYFKFKASLGYRVRMKGGMKEGQSRVSLKEITEERTLFCFWTLSV